MQRPSHARARKPFRYLGPEGQLGERLKRIAAHRRHVEDEYRSLERFLDQHPQLRALLPADNTFTRLITGGSYQQLAAYLGATTFAGEE
jgi:hypothetical protein